MTAYGPIYKCIKRFISVICAPRAHDKSKVGEGHVPLCAHGVSAYAWDRQTDGIKESVTLSACLFSWWCQWTREARDLPSLPLLPLLLALLLQLVLLLLALLVLLLLLLAMLLVARPSSRSRRRQQPAAAFQRPVADYPLRRIKSNQIKSNMTLIMVDKPQPSYNLLNVMWATHCLLLQWNPDWFYLSGTGSPG